MPVGAAVSGAGKNRARLAQRANRKNESATRGAVLCRRDGSPFLGHSPKIVETLNVGEAAGSEQPKSQHSAEDQPQRTAVAFEGRAFTPELLESLTERIHGGLLAGILQFLLRGCHLCGSFGFAALLLGLLEGRDGGFPFGSGAGVEFVELRC